MDSLRAFENVRNEMCCLIVAAYFDYSCEFLRYNKLRLKLVSNTLRMMGILCKKKGESKTQTQSRAKEMKRTPRNNSATEIRTNFLQHVNQILIKAFK